MADASIPTPVSRALTGLGILHQEFVHPGPVHSLEQAAAERGQQPGQVVRSIVFRVGEGDYVMVLVGGSAQVDWRALRRHVRQSRLTTANEAELLEATGYVVGAVAPFGLPRLMCTLIDESVLVHADISLGSGVRGTTIILSSADLRRALPEAEVGQFTKREP